MQPTNLDMISNRIKLAEFKLNQHRNLGSRSKLSVFEVAKLMDTVKNGDRLTKDRNSNIFFSLN